MSEQLERILLLHLRIRLVTIHQHIHQPLREGLVEMVEVMAEMVEVVEVVVEIL